MGKGVIMITNERQYKITNAQLENFRAAIVAFDIKAATKRVHSAVLAKAELAALNSEYESLSLQIQEYETLKSGTVDILKASTLEELPGILIRARIAKGLSQRKLAEEIGLKEQQIQRYEAEGYASANLRRLADVANALGLSISEVAEFNVTSQGLFDEDKDDFDWGQFPVKEMYCRHWFGGFSGSLSEAMINADELVKDFVEGSIDTPVRAAARQRVRSGGIVNRYALFAWQCRVLALARSQSVAVKYNPQSITDQWLANLKCLSREADGPQKAAEYLRKSGIRLVIVPRLSHTHLDGAAFLLPDGSPVVGMTLRFDRVDNFWFVLLHELIHIKKHLHKGNIESIFDNLDEQANDIEKEADECAGEVLIPENKWETALARYIQSKESIIAFANELKINPAIVAGKIRREANNYIILKDMVGQGEVRKFFPSVDFSY